MTKKGALSFSEANPFYWLRKHKNVGESQFCFLHEKNKSLIHTSVDSLKVNRLTAVCKLQNEFFVEFCLEHSTFRFPGISRLYLRASERHPRR